jgi:hypothetical protein
VETLSHTYIHAGVGCQIQLEETLREFPKFLLQRNPFEEELREREREREFSAVAVKRMMLGSTWMEQ